MLLEAILMILFGIMAFNLGRSWEKEKVEPCWRCDGKGSIWQADLSSCDECYACKGAGYMYYGKRIE